MLKRKNDLIERRKYLRLPTPIKVTYTLFGDDRIHTAVTRNISTDGISFQTRDKSLQEAGSIELKLDISDAGNPVHAKGTVIWKRMSSLEDDAPFDVGVGFSEIEEDNKNTFLKFLCDLMYNFPSDIKDEARG